MSARLWKPGPQGKTTPLFHIERNEIALLPRGAYTQIFKR